MTRSRDVSDVQKNLGGAVAPYVAGRNKFINSDYGVWQRGTTTTVTGTYGAQIAPDRYVASSIGGSTVCSQQTFTPGTAPVSGYESQYFLRLAPGASVTYTDLGQKIEDVRTFAGQTVTLSFWAKASSSVVFQPLINQFFGTGGSSVVNTYGPSTITLTTTWTRYTQTFTIPSVAGKTIGASSGCAIYLVYISGTLVSNNIDFWGLQIEAGSVATPFTTASGSIGGELALCQRYYVKLLDGRYIVNSIGTSTVVQLTQPSFMRTQPTITTNITNANYGSVWSFSQSGVALCSKTGTATLTFSNATYGNTFTMNLAGATYSPTPNAYESLSGAFFEISAEL